MLQVLHVFRSPMCADNDPSTHSDEDPTTRTLYRALDTRRCMQLTAVERGHHWSMLMDINID